MSGGLSGSLGFILVRYGGTQAQHKPLGIVRASFCEALNRVDEISVPCKTSFGNCAAVIGNSGVPVAMIFVANQNGSHNPYEAMKIEDFMKGVNVLWHTVRDYDA